MTMKIRLLHCYKTRSGSLYVCNCLNKNHIYVSFVHIDSCSLFRSYGNTEHQHLSQQPWRVANTLSTWSLAGNGMSVSVGKVPCNRRTYLSLFICSSHSIDFLSKKNYWIINAFVKCFWIPLSFQFYFIYFMLFTFVKLFIHIPLELSGPKRLSGTFGYFSSVANPMEHALNTWNMFMNLAPFQSYGFLHVQHHTSPHITPDMYLSMKRQTICQHFKLHLERWQRFLYPHWISGRNARKPHSTQPKLHQTQSCQASFAGPSWSHPKRPGQRGKRITLYINQNCLSIVGTLGWCKVGSLIRVWLCSNGVWYLSPNPFCASSTVIAYGSIDSWATSEGIRKAGIMTFSCGHSWSPLPSAES